MATVDPAWLLRAWESAGPAVPAARGAVLVREAGLAADLDAALNLPVDGLAGLVARLYAEQFGPAADAVLDCPACGASLDVAVPVGLVAAADDGATPEASDVTLPSGRRVRVRVPTTRDLLAVREENDVAAALLKRCVTEVRGASEGRPWTDLSEGPGVDRASDGPPGADAPALDDADTAAVDAALEDLAGAAAVVVRAACPECGTSVSAPVDVAAFLWDRVDREAPAVLADIADLAASFGWSEAEILALTPARRASYLGLVRGAHA